MVFSDESIKILIKVWRVKLCNNNDNKYNCCIIAKVINNNSFCVDGLQKYALNNQL